jgi:hypothetical protein
LELLCWHRVLYADQPFQSGWDATRGQSGTAGGYEKARQWNIDFAGEHRSQTSKASWKEAPPKACEQPAKSSPT